MQRRIQKKKKEENVRIFIILLSIKEKCNYGPIFVHRVLLLRLLSRIVVIKHFMRRQFHLQNVSRSCLYVHFTHVKMLMEKFAANVKSLAAPLNIYSSRLDRFIEHRTIMSYYAIESKSIRARAIFSSNRVFREAPTLDVMTLISQSVPLSRSRVDECNEYGDWSRLFECPSASYRSGEIVLLWPELMQFDTSRANRIIFRPARHTFR